MKARRITEITLETDETFTIRRNAPQAPCPVCGSLLAMVAPSQAAAILGVGAQAVLREIDSGQLHIQQVPGGRVLVCLESLQNAAPHLLPANSNLQINQTKENPS